MILSIDTNILFYSLNSDSPFHSSARGFIEGLRHHPDVAISEFVLAELYLLLRNPRLNKTPGSPGQATETIRYFRSHSHWRLVGFPEKGYEIHDEMWDIAANKGFPAHRLYDIRLALVLRRFGVTDLATANVKDFEGLGFVRVFNPLERV